MPAATPDGERLPVEVRVDGSTVSIAYRDGPTLTARLLAPDRTSDAAPVTETVESNAFFLWQRVRLPDPQWPRVIEVRVTHWAASRWSLISSATSPAMPTRRTSAGRSRPDPFTAAFSRSAHTPR